MYVNPWRLGKQIASLTETESETNVSGKIGKNHEYKKERRLPSQPSWQRRCPAPRFVVLGDCCRILHSLDDRVAMINCP